MSPPPREICARLDAELQQLYADENMQIANMSAGYLRNGANSGKTQEQILEDVELCRLKKLCEKRIEQANEMLAVLQPKLQEITSIIESFGC